MSAVATIAPDLFSDTRIQLIRNTVAHEAPADIFAAMIEIARVRGLDPLAKQISVIKFGDQWQVMTTIDGYRAIAEQSGTYAGQDEPLNIFDADRLISSTVTVYKVVQGMRVPFTAKVYFNEYDGRNYTWKKMPVTMLNKVAESHALRKAFPSLLSGLYTREEMDQAGPPSHVDVTSGEIIDAPANDFNPTEFRDRVVRESKERDAKRQKTASAKRDYSAIYAAGREKGIKPDDVKKLAYATFSVDSMTTLTDDQCRQFLAYLNAEEPDSLAQDLYEATESASDNDDAGR